MNSMKNGILNKSIFSLYFKHHLCLTLYIKHKEWRNFRWDNRTELITKNDDIKLSDKLRSI